MPSCYAYMELKEKMLLEILSNKGINTAKMRARINNEFALILREAADILDIDSVSSQEVNSSNKTERINAFSELAQLILPMDGIWPEYIRQNKKHIPGGEYIEKVSIASLLEASLKATMEPLGKIVEERLATLAANTVLLGVDAENVIQKTRNLVKYIEGAILYDWSHDEEYAKNNPLIDSKV